MHFIEPMLLLPSDKLPEGPAWTYELKLEGYRAIGIKTGGAVRLRSRNDKDFNRKYPGIATALAALPDETVIDREVVALDEAGRPSFNALQNHGSARSSIFFYAFDVLILAGRNVMGETLAIRRELLIRDVLPMVADPSHLWHARFILLRGALEGPAGRSISISRSRALDVNPFLTRAT
jgi:ATP-dependent DNA ligase